MAFPYTLLFSPIGSGHFYSPGVIWNFNLILFIRHSNLLKWEFYRFFLKHDTFRKSSVKAMGSLIRLHIHAPTFPDIFSTGASKVDLQVGSKISINKLNLSSISLPLSHPSSVVPSHI